MSYAAAIDQLNALAPELLTQPGRPRRKFSLREIGDLLAALENPQRQFPAVLIAGTNGKGSTAATLASILSAAGLRTGLYTSPHLERVNERIRVDGTEISDSDFARWYFRVCKTAERLVAAGTLAQEPSFFETLTAMGFLHFAEAQVDIAVLEVGMGGRLDATNIVDPLVSIITDISMDHMEWLGSNIAAITREKAGILRRGGVLVTLPQHPDANQVLGEVAEELDVRAISATAYMPPTNATGAFSANVLGIATEIASPLWGVHQHRNVALAVAAAVELAERHGFGISSEAIAEGIRRTTWPGRLEKIYSGGVEWVLDVAHNPAGAWALRAGLRDVIEQASGKLHSKTFIFSCLRDKPLNELAQILFPLFDRVVLAPIHSPRATPMADMLSAAAATGTEAVPAGSVQEALEIVRRDSPAGLNVISGSVYLVGEARSLLLGHAGGRGSRA